MGEESCGRYTLRVTKNGQELHGEYRDETGDSAESSAERAEPNAIMYGDVGYKRLD